MKIIDYINANFSIGKRLFYGKWELNYGDCKNRTSLNEINLYYHPLSIRLEQDFDLDIFGKALNLSLENLPDWFKSEIKCEKDDSLPYVEYFEGFKKSLETYEFNLSYASGMRDCLDGFFKIDKSVCFCDIADFLNNFSLHYEKVLPQNESKLIAYYENSNQIRAVIDGRINNDCVNFVDYKETPCALIAASYSNFVDLQCGFDLDNVFDIMETGYEGVEGYVFEDGYCLSYGKFKNKNLINISNREHLPKKITFYNYDYGEDRSLNVVKFSKAVLCNEPIIKWIEAGIRAFEEYLVQKTDNGYYLISDDEEIKLDDSLRWCDLKGLKVIDESDVWSEREKNYQIAYKIILNRRIKYLEDKIKTPNSKDKASLQRQLIKTKDELKKFEDMWF